MSNRIPALIRMLGSPNDNEALEAARALVREMANNGLHLDDLAQVGKRHKRGGRRRKNPSRSIMRRSRRQPRYTRRTKTKWTSTRQSAQSERWLPSYASLTTIRSI
jgi:hypothetical protein